VAGGSSCQIVKKRKCKELTIDKTDVGEHEFIKPMLQGKQFCTRDGEKELLKTKWRQSRKDYSETRPRELDRRGREGKGLAKEV